MRPIFIGVFFVVLINCTTFINKPETRVSPICEWRKENKSIVEENKKAKDESRWNRNRYTEITQPKQEFPTLDLLSSRQLKESAKLYKLESKIQQYAKTLNELLDTGVVSEDITKLKVSLLDRMDSLHMSLVSVYEKEGDEHYSAYNFSKALESYMDAKETIQEVHNEKVQKSPLEKIEKKLKLTRETGENFLQNKIKSYVDQANFLYLDDQNDKAIDAMKLARDELYKTIFFNLKTISLYNEQAKIMKLDEFHEGFCNSIFNKFENDSLKKNVRFKVSHPESFTTKTGIKFTKVIRKDGNPVYVSDVIRPDKANSWYYARDYSEKMNLEENCKDCYQLPEFEDIENLKINQEYEELWLKSWSPAPLGMTLGNIYFGFYTFDFLHDMIAHPFTWKSYVYPISPDRVSSHGGSWVDRIKIIRSADPSYYGWSRKKGFRLVRPLR